VTGIILDVVAWISGFSEMGQKIQIVEADYSLQQIIEIVQLIIFISTAILFLIWIHRAHRNLPALGARNLKYSPKWAVWGFFVPILFFYRPFQVVREIWKASDPRLGEYSWQRWPTPSLIQWWWALHLIVMISGSAFTTDGGTISVKATLPIRIVGAILAIFVVRKIDQRQEEKSKRLATAHVIRESAEGK
jgi:hypothetical protein